MGNSKWGDLGMGIAGQTAGGIVGAGMGLLLEGHNDKRQLEQERKLQEQQMGFNKQMAEFNRMQQMKMWEDTNYGAQIAQLKKAGLNPGLIYGMSGGGGATTNAAQAAGPTSGGAPKGGGETMGMAGMGIQNVLQAELLRAQKENIEADTKVKLTDAGYTAGPKTENTVLDNIIKKYTGKEAQDTYEKVTGPNRGIQAKTYQDELEARQGLAGTIYELWVEGKLHDKSVAEIEQLLLNNEKTKAETRNVIKTMDILEENLKGAKLDNVIREIETEMQKQTGVDRSAPTWLKIIARLFGNILER